MKHTRIPVLSTAVLAVVLLGVTACGSSAASPHAQGTGSTIAGSAKSTAGNTPTPTPSVSGNQSGPAPKAVHGYAYVALPAQLSTLTTALKASGLVSSITARG